VRSARAKLALALLIGSIVVAASALAVAATRTKNTVLPSAATKDATVRCPRGRHVTGFGFESHYQSHSGQATLPTKLIRPSASKVLAGATNLGSGTGSFQTIARCGAEPKLKTVKTEEPVPMGAQESIVAECPHGSSVRLGGFTESVDPAGHIVAANGLERKSARQLKVSGLSIGAMDGELGAYAYCAKGSPSVHAVEKTANLKDEEEKTVISKCPRGERLLMGGFEVQHYEAGDGDIYVVGMKPAGKRGWAVTGQKVLPIFGKLTSIAYCH
jgi:hypothetical protein